MADYSIETVAGVNVALKCDESGAVVRAMFPAGAYSDEAVTIDFSQPIKINREDPNRVRLWALLLHNVVFDLT